MLHSTGCNFEVNVDQDKKDTERDSYSLNGKMILGATGYESVKGEIGAEVSKLYPELPADVTDQAAALVRIETHDSRVLETFFFLVYES